VSKRNDPRAPKVEGALRYGLRAAHEWYPHWSAGNLLRAAAAAAARDRHASIAAATRSGSALKILLCGPVHATDLACPRKETLNIRVETNKHCPAPGLLDLPCTCTTLPPRKKPSGEPRSSPYNSDGDWDSTSGFRTGCGPNSLESSGTVAVSYPRKVRAVRTTSP